MSLEEFNPDRDIVIANSMYETHDTVAVVHY